MTIAFERLAAALADRYRIVRELGQGGMATVYLAQDIKHDRNVALKVLKPELAAVLGAERFVIEIKTTAALQHPHILPLFDSGTADGFLYYVMPFIDGETLRGKLDRETQLGIDEAVRIATNVADALDYAHRHGVIHRDIKPENILLHDGRPTVADFGIALAVSAAAGGRMTETGLSLGTPHYMSPEQATAEKEITARSDVYSLGSVLYEMLTGNPPHTGASAQQIIMKIVTEEAAPVTKLRKSVPVNVAAAVARALEKLPADRFASAAEFAAALGNPAFATGAIARASAPRLRASRDANRALIALCVLLVAALGWQASFRSPTIAPVEYDVALPDGAPVAMLYPPNFAIAPDGGFVIYRREGLRELWYRSLRDGSVRRIGATEGAMVPTISPDGKSVAFIRWSRVESTIEVLSLDGSGAATVIGRSRTPGALQWLPDRRILLTEGDGRRARFLDVGGGPSTDVKIQYCIAPTLLPDGSSLLCGGGGDKQASLASLRDSATKKYFRVGTQSAGLFGADFRIIDGKYLIYVSNGGDLLAAPVNLASNEVGHSVRMITGLGRDAYTGIGSYAVSANGTLVYAAGLNGAVGNLVRTDGEAVDTLPVGRESFLQFAVSPDGKRLAVVVELLDGQELRIYDLKSGEYIVWMRGSWLRQPVWSASGDRLISSTPDSVFVGPPDATARPQAMFGSAFPVEGFAWMRDGRLIGTIWSDAPALVAYSGKRPNALDTLATFAAIGRPSPDGRWLAYSSADFESLWLEPFPRTGQRYAVGAGFNPQWLSPSEFVVSSDQGVIDRIHIEATVPYPRITRQPWFIAPRLVSIAAGSFALTPDGRVVYKQGAEIVPARYLRVVPEWTAQMKHAVAEANR